MSKQMYIIPGFGDRPTFHWFPWLEKQMKKEGFQTKTVEFPDPSHPDVINWLNCLKESILEINQTTYFVAHSLGCVTLLRYLQEIVRPTRIGGYILVAGFYGVVPNIKSIPTFVNLDSRTVENLSNFSGFALDANYLASITKNRYAIVSEDDCILPTKYNMTKTVSERLNAQLYSIEKGGHFLASDGFSTFPLVLELLKNMIKEDSSIEKK